MAEFLELLQKFKINLLVDVRTHPVSRYQPDFSKRNLEQNLAAAGIGYLFLGREMGGRPKDPGLYVDGAVDYHKLAQQPVYQQGLARLHTLQETGSRLALMCAEQNPKRCHRAGLIAESLVQKGVPVNHIIGAGDLITHQDLNH